MEEKIRKNVWWLIPLVFSGLIYANSVRGIFFWDDRGVILENTAVKSWTGALSTFNPDYWLKSHPGAKGQYRPLRNLLFTLDYSLWHTRPFGYHLTNFLLNLAAVLLVCVVSKELFASKGAALLAGLVFAAHPMHVETINFVKNRSDMLCLALLLVSLLSFMRGRRWVSVGVFFLALFAKEFAVAFPLVLLLLPRGGLRERARLALPHFALSAGLIYLKLAFLRPGGPQLTDPVIDGVSPFWVVVSTVTQYFYLLFFPFKLELDRQLSVISSPFSPAFLFFLLCLAAAAVWLARSRSEHKGAYLFSLAWIFLFLGPVSNVIPLTARLLAEQRLYVPSAGLAFLAGGVAREIYLRSGLYRNYLAGALLVGLFLSGYQVMRRNELWSNELLLWAQAVKENPSNMRAYENLGASLLRAKDYEGAERVYSRMLPRFPKESSIRTNLAVIAQARGDLRGALAHFEKARELAPNDAQVSMNLGSAYFLLGDRKAAMKLYQEAAGLAPDEAGIYANIGVLYAGDKKFREAAGFFKRAVELDPDLIEARLNLATAYKTLGLEREAQAELEEAQARMAAGAGSSGYNPSVTFR